MSLFKKRRQAFEIYGFIEGRSGMPPWRRHPGEVHGHFGRAFQPELEVGRGLTDSDQGHARAGSGE